MSRFHSTDLDSPIRSVCMPLIVGRAGEVEFASGTAFLIGAGLAVTAYHVIDDFLCRFHSSAVDTGAHSLDFEILTFLMLGDGRFLPMKVGKIWRSAPLDLAVLALGVPLDWPEHHTWKVPAISLLPPLRGSSVVAFGYARSAVSRRADGGFVFQSDPSTSTGEVLEIHHEFRDSARLPFPCFRTNARFDEGMSGGPVINQSTGEICGVICSSFPATSDGEDHASYTATLWPILGTAIEESTGEATHQLPLRALFERGVLHAEDLHRTKIEEYTPGLYEVAVSYNAQQWARGSATG